jgi:aspartyl-tRNA(Asn)/glutamyl-tRNA(Gln) amidotransferase subunit A
MAHATLGSDTGGSCRIPAAFNGIVGYKPTQSRIPTGGAAPLSTSLDSVGPLARTVQCCASLDAILAGDEPQKLRPAAPASVRLVIPTGVFLEDMDAEVARAFEIALARLSEAGFSFAEKEIKAFGHIPALNAKGGFAAAESYAWHRPFLEQKEALYDPRVLARIMRGREQTAADYIDMLRGRAALIEEAGRELEGFDGTILPTVPIIPPKLSEVETKEGFNRANFLILRNTYPANMMNGCSISLPMNAPGEPPMGLMISAIGGHDAALFSIAASIENALQASLR